MKETFNRWQVLAASTAILLCTGAVYSFSVFAGPLSSSTRWSMSEIMLAFAINSAIGPIPMILGGYLVDNPSFSLYCLQMKKQVISKNIKVIWRNNHGKLIITAH